MVLVSMYVSDLQIFFDCSAAIAEIAGNRTDLSQFAQKLSLCQTFLVKIEQQHQKIIHFQLLVPLCFGVKIQNVSHYI